MKYYRIKPEYDNTRLLNRASGVRYRKHKPQGNILALWGKVSK